MYDLAALMMTALYCLQPDMHVMQSCGCDGLIVGIELLMNFGN